MALMNLIIIMIFKADKNIIIIYIKLDNGQEIYYLIKNKLFF